MLTTCQQAGNKQCSEHILLTSCWNNITTCLLQVLLQPVRFYVCTTHVCTTHGKTHKLLQICSQAVDKLSSHCLFPVVVTSLEQAGNNL
jgi:hypothetical protein